MIEKRRAYAKVNIGLKVGERRPDGYHNIDSYFLKIPFYDELDLSLEEGDFCVFIEGNEGYLSSSEDLMAKAARLYKEKTGIGFRLHITINKMIPTQAGLGGGSSDAALILLFLNEKYKALNKEELMSLAKNVGADVPFFVSGEKVARVGGIGEVITPLQWNLPYEYIYLFRAKGSGVSTKDAYRRLDEREVELSILPPLSYPLTRASFPNDFEILEGREMVDALKAELDSDDYLSLSGSGSVWFLLSRSEKHMDSPLLLGGRKVMMDEKGKF